MDSVIARFITGNVRNGYFISSVKFIILIHICFGFAARFYLAKIQYGKEIPGQRSMCIPMFRADQGSVKAHYIP